MSLKSSLRVITNGNSARLNCTSYHPGAFHPYLVSRCASCGSALRKPVEGRDRVRQILWTAAAIYESLAFTDQVSSGRRSYVEWVATAFGGKQLRGSTIIVTNEDGKIEHAVVQHRPLDELLAFSAEMGKRMSSMEYSEYFWKVRER